MKTCKNCLAVKPFSDFSVCRVGKNKKTYYQSECKPCRSYTLNQRTAEQSATLMPHNYLQCEECYHISHKVKVRNKICKNCGAQKMELFE